MPAATELQARLEQERDRFVVTYAGYLGENDQGVLDELERRVRARPVASAVLFVQAEGFTGFHRAQVGRHAQAITRMKDKLYGVAIANASGAVRFAIASVSLLVRVPLKGFDSVGEAHRWLDSLRPLDG